MKRKRIAIVTAILLIAAFAGCAAPKSEDTALYQVSTLQALIVGAYEGEVTAEQLVSYGDTGLGTFDDLDGEMIVIDGKVYKARVDGTVTEVSKDETIPFANVAKLGDMKGWSITFDGGYDCLKKMLDDAFPNENMPVLFCIEGSFTDVEYRSVPEQTEPYPPLTEVVKDQTVFSQAQINGTIVGFRFPGYLDDINATGYHLHFISDDRTKAGHLLEVASGEMTVIAKTLDEMHVVFPDNIKDIDMTADEEDVEAVEKK